MTCCSKPYRFRPTKKPFSPLHIITTHRYFNYAECFPLRKDDGSFLSAKDIDAHYCISDVMPGAFLHLAVREFAAGEGHVYVKEDADGNYSDEVLTGGMTYYLYVQQDPEQEMEDMEKMRALWGKAAAGGTLLGDEAPRGEGCSCLFGSPCVDQYVCLDWDNRMAVAKAHGMLPLAG